MLGRRGEFEGVADWLPVLPLCNVTVSRKNWARHCHTHHNRMGSLTEMPKSNTSDEAELLEVVGECTKSCHYMACLGAPAETLSHVIGQRIPSLSDNTRNMFVKIIQTQIDIFRQEMSFSASAAPLAGTEFPELCEVNMQIEHLSAPTKAISQEKENKERDIPLEQLRSGITRRSLLTEMLFLRRLLRKTRTDAEKMHIRDTTPGVRKSEMIDRTTISRETGRDTVISIVLTSHLNLCNSC